MLRYTSEASWVEADKQLRHTRAKWKPENCEQGKGMFLYSAVSSPLDHSKRFTLFALPGRPVHSDTNSASLGSILAMQQLRATTNMWTEASRRERKCQKLRNRSKGGFESGLSGLRVRHSTTN